GQTGGTYTVSSQYYTWTKVGDRVDFNLNVSDVSGTTPTGDFLINFSGTTMPASGSVERAGRGMVIVTNCLVDIYSIGEEVVGDGGVSAIRIYVQTDLDGSNYTRLNNVDFSNTSFTIKGTYFTP